MAKKMSMNLQNLPPAVRILIGVAPAIVLVLIFFFLIYRPKSAEITVLKDDIARQQKQIAKDEGKVAKLPELKRRYAQLERSILILSARLPEEKEVSNLLKQVSDFGIHSGLGINLWKPGAKKVHQSGIVYEIPVQVKMNGRYHNLGMFYSRLTGMNRIVNVMDIHLKTSSKKVLGMLDISFQAVTFSAIPEEERAALSQGQQQGRR